MKRLIIIAFAVLAVLSCKKDDNLQLGGWMSFEQVAAKDYKYMKTAAPEGFFFYEIQCQLNESPAQKPADEIKVYRTMSVVGTESNRVFTISTNLETGAEDVGIVENDRWIGDFDMGDPTKVNISFAKAVKMLQEQTEFEVPDSKIMTFSQPTLGLILHPRYIFGERIAGFVYVDAVTGEIGSMADGNKTGFGGPEN